ncbi:DUF438 domain-containing protein [Pyrococcus sp. ST04]|uniref:DUF438 domain-containing protein n=1 Tax=Pyrococcus sp. ST04 TaxID=1183377 RepID=UPI0002605E62|nr:DUF438 domain-containing protein [Pyrococcus sp. ST04]AFK22582.1 putative PAS/PAC sensor protein [Pyrococcus sp. ST04]
MSEFLKNFDEKKEKLKNLLLELHEGKSVEELKEEFKEVLASISPLEIPLIEQELVREGVSVKDIAKMCDLHVEVFRESVAGSGKFDYLPDGHPLKTLYLENKEIMKDSEMLNLYAQTLAKTKDETARLQILDVLGGIISDLRRVGPTHYSREEMLIFPYIERLGLRAVATVLWTKHDEIRFMIRRLWELFKMRGSLPWNEFVQRLTKSASEVSRALADMVFREDNILYPTVEALLGEGEWKAVKLQEGEFGYYKIDPPDWDPDIEPVFPWEIDTTLSAEKILSLPRDVQKAIEKYGLTPDEAGSIKREGDIELGTGYLSVEELKAIFRTLPVDITFVDRDDRVRFFSPGERIFARPLNILGRPVQLCHPPKSVHIVNKILKAFKEGKKDKAEFWIRMGDKLVYILYLPVRDENGEYLGTLEVTMDVKRYKELEGEKRLLDWRD